MQLGRILGPFAEPPLDGLICSPLNLVPKAGNPGKFRLIHNLAYPYNQNSVNANIPDHQAVVSYAPFDKAVRICQSLGSHCYIAKMDYDSAFRIFPISGQDIHLLGFTLNNQFYINSTMAFGARSSCRIFEMFATAMEWALIKKTGWKTCTHYLDDFFLGRGTYSECAAFMETVIYHLFCHCRIATTSMLGNKSKSPAKAIPYLDDNTIAPQAWLEENFNGDQKLFNVTIWTACRRLLAERRAWFKAASAASRSDKTWGYVANTKGLLPQDKIAAQERLKDLDTFLKNLPESLRYKVDEIKPQESHGANIKYPTLLPVLLQE